MCDEGDVAFPVGGIPYHSITDAMTARGYAPKCPHCGKRMSPADDHGRFICLCRGPVTVDGVTGIELRPRSILQVDTAGMSNEEKAQVPPINRLKAPPTAAGQAFLKAMMGPGADSQEYQDAVEALRKERGEE
jgi:hypothetical protein